MKQLSLITLLMLSAVMAFGQNTCDFDLDKDALNKVLGSYQYVKTFRVDGKGGRMPYLEYTIVMKEGESYKFHIQTAKGDGDGIVMKIYDRRTKARVLTNFSASGLDTELTYTCTKTGIYDIKFSFKGSTSYCGVCVCGLKGGGA